MRRLHVLGLVLAFGLCLTVVMVAVLSAKPRTARSDAPTAVPTSLVTPGPHQTQPGRERPSQGGVSTTGRVQPTNRRRSAVSAKATATATPRPTSTPTPVPTHVVPPLAFHGRHYATGDLFAIGSYVAQRAPGLAAPLLTRARATGADWLREEFTADRLHNGTSAPYHWSSYDRVVRLERRLGFHILGLLDYNNTWGFGNHADMPHRRITRLARDFARYAYAIARHYRHEITTWQVWNEPDLHTFWEPTPNAADYALLLRLAYTAIKRANPHARVVLAGPSGADPNALDYVAAVVRAGGRFDVLSLQPYRDVPDMELLGEVRGLSRYHRPIWFTEMGWAGENNCAACGDEPWQAARLARLYLVAALGHVQRVFWYNLRDDGLQQDFEHHFGLLEWNLAAKPAYAAYQIAFQFFNRARYLGVDDLGPDVYAYHFVSRGAKFVALWNNSDGYYGLDIPWHGATARALDWSGTVVAATSRGMLDVSVAPRTILYLVHDASRIHVVSSAPISIPLPSARQQRPSGPVHRLRRSVAKKRARRPPRMRRTAHRPVARPKHPHVNTAARVPRRAPRRLRRRTHVRAAPATPPPTAAPRRRHRRRPVTATEVPPVRSRPRPVVPTSTPAPTERRRRAPTPTPLPSPTPSPTPAPTPSPLAATPALVTASSPPSPLPSSTPLGHPGS